MLKQNAYAHIELSDTSNQLFVSCVFKHFKSSVIKRRIVYKE